MALSLTAQAAFGSLSRLEVRSSATALGKPVALTIDHTLADGSSGFVLYVPRGYQAQLGQAPGTAVGQLVSATVVVGGVPSSASDGGIVAAEPEVDSADPALASCPAGPHDAVWLIDAATPAGAVQVPLVVDALNEGPESAYASLRIEACPPPGTGIVSLAVRFEDVFTNPSSQAVYVWRAVDAPDGASPVESRSLVPLPVVLSLHGSYRGSHASATLSGRLTAAGESVSHEVVSLFAGPKPGSTSRAGSVTTNADGAFRTTRSITATTYFRATASADAADVTGSECFDPIAAGGCASATLAAFTVESATVRVSVPPPPTLQYGSRGAAVKLLQTQLARLHYLPAGYRNGVFDDRTWHAVVAFQGWQYLGRTGVVDRRTWRTLAVAGVPRPFGGLQNGDEIDVSRQVLLLVRNGATFRAIHVSTAAPGHYTPRGHFRVYRKEILSWSVPFHAWMPYANYFYGGFALHGFASVPSYPASHGCVRVPMVEAPGVYAFTALGTPLWVR